jgi:hypothetical protein
VDVRLKSRQKQQLCRPRCKARPSTNIHVSSNNATTNTVLA